MPARYRRITPFIINELKKKEIPDNVMERPQRDNPNIRQGGRAAMAYKPSEKEEEYFKRLEFEKKIQLEQERQKTSTEGEKKRLKDLHFMHCPKCGMNLVEINYHGIKLDKCSACGGVWLDAGELEQVVCKEKGVLDSFFGVFKKG
jgi:uncharacterized protein